MEEILNDFCAMQSAADVLLSSLTDEEWERIPPKNCWQVSVKDAIMHVAFYDKVARMLTTGEAKVMTDITKTIERDENWRILTFKDMTPGEVLSYWRKERTLLNASLYAKSPKDRIPWVPGIVMSAKSLVSARQMELWAHMADVCFATNRKILVPNDGAILPALFLSWQSRPNQYKINGLSMPNVPMHLSLTLPSGKIWEKGEENAQNYVKGNALEWALVAIRRLNPADTKLEIHGEAAREWSMIVQTYAGEADKTPEPLGNYSIV